jgi:uncharacterized protein (TIGR02246 family)
MKRIFVVAAAVVAAATGWGMGESKSASDEAAIRSIPQRISEGWNQGNGRKIGDVYAVDGTLVAGDGTVTQGSNQIGEYHDRLFADRLKGTRLLVEVRNVRFLGRDIALMQTAGGILWPGEQQLAPGNDGIQSFVTVKQDGVWRVLLFQNTRVLPRQ